MEIKFFRKRSGRIVNFRPQKISTAIGKAIKDAIGITGREMDVKTLSDELAGRVVDLLNDEKSEFFVGPDAVGSRVPRLEHVQDTVVHVLASAEGIDGYDGEFAKLVSGLYSDYRKRREEARKQLKVRSEKDSADVTDKSLLLGDRKNVLNGWDRERIIADLKERNVNDEIAEKVAKETESALLKTGLSSVSSDLVSEMVNSVMADNGLPIRVTAGKGYTVDKDFIDSLIKEKSVENSNVVGNNPEAVAFDIASNVFKQYALDNVFSKDIGEAHMMGAIHVHDLNFPCRGYCGSHSLEYLKKYGLKGLVNLNTESKPAKTASVLTGHLNTFLASMQAYYAGALGLGYVNILYAPFLVGMDDKQLKQVAQELIFNCSQNAFSRGGQSLFIDTNVHSGVPSYLKDVPAIGPGGKYMAKYNSKGGPWQEGEVVYLEETTDDGCWALRFQNPYRPEDNGIALKEKDGKQWIHDQPSFHVMRYRDYEEEAAKFAEVLLEVWKEGDANGRVFAFPKCDFHVSAETFTNARQYKVFEKACDVASHNGSTYFVFDRDSVSLASCCFKGDTRVLIENNSVPSLTTFEEAYAKLGPVNKTIKVYDRGKWRKAKVLRLKGDDRRMVTLEMGCGKSLTVTADHEFPTPRGVLKAFQLAPGDMVELSHEYLKGGRNCLDRAHAGLFGALAGAMVMGGRVHDGVLSVTVGDCHNGKMMFGDMVMHMANLCGYDKFIHMCRRGDATAISTARKEVVDGVCGLLRKTASGWRFSMRLVKEDEEARIAAMFGMMAATMLPVDMDEESMSEIYGQVEAIATTIGITCSVRKIGGCSMLEFSSTVNGMPDGSVKEFHNKEYLKILRVRNAPPCEWVYCFSMMDAKKPFFTLPSGIVTHNCRLKVQITDMSLLQHPERLRSLGFQNVTINIPQCAYRAKHRYDKEGEGNIDKLNEFFLAEIDSMMDICKAAHMQKKAFVESLMKPGAPMWQMAKPSNDGNPYLDLNTAVYIIGMIGLNDAVHYLTGEEMHESDAAMDYALKVMTHMYLRSKEYSKETGLTFKLEESPAESAARRLAKADLALYREDALKVFKGTEDAAYYTNSIHLSADAPVSLVERIRKQSMFHSIIESGAIIHAFIGEERPSSTVIGDLVRQVFLNTQCAQLVFSPEFTYCNDCGREQAGLKEKCDQCGSTDVVGVTRVVGYYSLVQNFNKSKRYGELPARQRGKYSVEEA